MDSDCIPGNRLAGSRKDHTAYACATRNGPVVASGPGDEGFISAEASSDPYWVCSHGPIAGQSKQHGQIAFS